MKVLVDGTASSTGGGVTYLRSLLAAALAADTTLEVALAVVDPTPFRGTPNLERMLVLEPFRGRASLAARLAWQQLRLGDMATETGADLVFSPSEISPLRSRTPVVLGFQNPNLYERPEPFPWQQAVRTKLLLAAARRCAPRAAAHVFVSEPFRRVVRDQIHATARVERVVEPGIDEAFRPEGTGRWADMHPYVLAVSDIYPYKNFGRLIDAFAPLAASRPDIRLLIAGKPVYAKTVRSLRSSIVERGLGERVLLLGAVPFAEMPSLYRGAECLVFPSLLESFGFPPLEAMACGTAVACSSASVMPGICGDAVDYFDPLDVAAITRAMERLLDDAALRDRCVELGARHVKRFDWTRSGAALAETFAAARESAS